MIRSATRKAARPFDARSRGSVETSRGSSSEILKSERAGESTLAEVSMIAWLPAWPTAKHPPPGAQTAAFRNAFTSWTALQCEPSKALISTELLNVWAIATQALTRHEMSSTNGNLVVSLVPHRDQCRPPSVVSVTSDGQRVLPAPPH